MPLTFADARIDLLNKARDMPTPFAYLRDELQIPPDKTQRFREFFTLEAPVTGYPARVESGVRVRYFGHACVLLESAQTSILIDPLLPWGPGGDDGRYGIYDLPKRIDYVVLSHNHQDHCNPETLLQLRDRIDTVVVPDNNSGAIVDPSMKLALKQLGFENIVVVHPFDCIPLLDGSITSLPFAGEHVDLDIHTRHGIDVELGGRRIVFLVDSDGRDPSLYRRIARRRGKRADAIFIGMECHGAPLTWLYGPLLTKPICRRDDESRRLSGLDADRAWAVLGEFEAGRVFVYAMGQEPWLKYIMGLKYTENSVQLTEVRKLLQRCCAANIEAEHLYISKDLHYDCVTRDSRCGANAGQAPRACAD